MIISQILRNWKTWVFLFFLFHILIALFLGQFSGAAPDEIGYLFAFENLYTWPISTVPQSGSGWIAAPTIFLWLVYFPSKFFTLIGASELLALRFGSILYVTLALIFSLRILITQRALIRQKIVVIAMFSIPSFFIWTSVGLREAFLALEIALILTGFNELMRRNWKFGVPYLISGAYGLISTKFYIWVCISIAIFVTAFIFFLEKKLRQRILQAVCGIVIIPAIIFTLTSSDYGLSYIFSHKLDVSSVGERSGDSVSTVLVTDTSEGGKEQLVTFHGDYSLLALRTFLKGHPDAVLARTLENLQITSFIEDRYKERLKLALQDSSRETELMVPNSSAHIIKPGSISNPISVITSALRFIFGPFPWDEQLGFAARLTSLETPLWWIIYLIVIFKMLWFRKSERLLNPTIVFPSVFMFGFILLSALVEVNLGTSFRHRSVIVVPLVFLYTQFIQKTSGSKETNAKI